MTNEISPINNWYVCGDGAGVLTDEVLVLSRHVVGAGGTPGCSVWPPVCLPRVLSCLVLCAVPACLRHRDAVHPSLLRGKLRIATLTNALYAYRNNAK